MSIILNTGKVSIVIEEVSKESKSWKVIQSSEYKPDRQEWMLKKFRKEFPKQAEAVSSFEILNSLASRSMRVSQWFANSSAEFILEVDVPLYLKDLIDPKEYKNASENLQLLNKNAASRSSEEVKTVQEYKSNMEKISMKYDRINEGIIKNKIVRILSINSQYLPITLQLMIENFTPAADGKSPDKKTYAREILTQFKISLIKYFTAKENKESDLEEFLKEIAEK